MAPSTRPWASQALRMRLTVCSVVPVNSAMSCLLMGNSISIPPSIVKSGQTLPEGTQMFARSLEQAQAVTLSLTPEGTNFAARLDVRCASPEVASALAAQLTKTTNLLRELIMRENNRPNPADLSGFLTSGTFLQDGVRVRGYWPMQRALIDNLLGGG